MKPIIVLSIVVLGIVSNTNNLYGQIGGATTTHNLKPLTAMKETIPYLIYPGTCRQALEFYNELFGGEIVQMQTFGESSMDVPEQIEDRIFNSEFKAGNLHIMASDDMPGNEVTMGSNFALFVRFDDAAEKERVFNKLSEGGNVLFPIEDNFGMVVDKFGIQWMVESTE